MSSPQAPRATSPGTLFLVATPIGNLDDITLRALAVLRDADVVAAEDTRRTANLLRHFGITTPLVSVHAHNEHERLDTVLRWLAQGQAVAVVSDAGTPLISDPGAVLVSAARQAGFAVVAVPGASAVLAALVGSGESVSSPNGEFVFLGFPPNKQAGRLAWLKRAAVEPRTVVFFEAPHRLRATLEDMRQVMDDRKITIARELTKIHEEYRRGTPSELLDYVVQPKGEFVLVIPPPPATEDVEAQAPDADEVYSVFCRITETPGSSRREAVATIARRYGLSNRDVYGLIEQGKTRHADSGD